MRCRWMRGARREARKRREGRAAALIASIVRRALAGHRAVVAAAIALLVVSGWQLQHAKVDTLPEFAPVTVDVQTEALGLSAEEVEQLITVPLEQDLLDGVAWLESIHSESVPGLSKVEMVFEPGTDLYRARQVVQERISQAAGLPNVSRPPQMIQPVSSTSRVSMVSLSSKQLSPIRIGVLARWTIRPRLLAVPGVANVAIWGQRERQLQVQVDPKKLREKNVSLERVISSAGNSLWVSPLTFLEASTPGTGGFIDTPSQRLGIQHNLPIIGAQDLAKVAIDESTPGAPLTLGDVATVVEDHQPLIGDAVLDADTKDGGFLLVVEKLPGANTTDVAKGVDEALESLSAGLVGVDVDSSAYQPASYVDSSRHNTSRAIVLGLVLGLLVLFAVLLEWRAAVASGVAIIVSFMSAALVLHVFGTTFNLVTSAGLLMAIGVVVHDAVHSVHAVRQRPGDEQDVAPRSSILLAAQESAPTAVWATVVFALVVAPIFVMDGLSGDAFFPPAALACLIAIVVSVVVSITLTPALSLLLAPARGSATASPARRWSEPLRRGVAPALRTPILAIVAIVLVLGAALWVPRADKSLLPSLNDPDLTIHWTALPGTSLGEMDRITGRAAIELRKTPGVAHVVTQVGQAILGDQAVGSDSAEMWVRLDPAADHDAALGAVRRVVGGYIGVGHRVSTYGQNRTSEVLGQTSHAITLRVFGSDLGVLHQKADELRNVLAGIKGVNRSQVSSQPTEPTMEVQVDLARARQAGVKPGDVRRAAATLLSGIRVGSLFQDQKVFDVQIWSTPETRHSVADVLELPIDTPSGTAVRLGDVADVRVRPTEPVIRHEDVSRYVDVTADVGARNVGAVRGALREKLKDVAFPLEYHAEVLGTYDAQRQAQTRLLGFAVAAAVGVVLLLQAAVRSWRVAFIGSLLLPVAASGAVIAAWAMGGPWTFATVGGILAVVALAVRGMLSPLQRLGRLRLAGVPLDAALVERVAGEHLIPTVASAVVTAAVLVPTVVLGDRPGLEAWRPMAILILGGLVTTTVANVLLLPGLYLRFAPPGDPRESDVERDLDEAENTLASRGASIG
jgi:Cu/Ag efflux pump CusA